MTWFRKPPAPATAGDLLFRAIETWQGEAPWGRVLDAGTGEHSLGWLVGRPTRAWTAVTGDPTRQQSLRTAFSTRMRPVDRVVDGDWADPGLLRGEVFDVVLADYLLGALDGFAPYFQDRLLSRLRPHVAGRLYLVGLEPYADPAPDEAGAIIVELARLRDAAILLAGDRCYREYPHTWVLRQLRQAGFQVVNTEVVPIVYSRRFIDGQLDVARRKLPRFRDPGVAAAMGQAIEALRGRAHAVHDRLGGLRVGADYVIEARPVGG